MINKHETIYQELTPDEIREQYGLQIQGKKNQNCL